MAVDVQPKLRRKAASLLRPLSAAEREGLLMKSWAAHDARWFTAAARAWGMDVTNELNRTVARELGRAEAVRLSETLGLPEVQSLEDWLVIQETFLTLLGPSELDYRITGIGPQTYEMDVRHCGALETAARAGVASRYDCTLFERIGGWLEGLGLAGAVTPRPGRCLKARNEPCRYSITVRPAVARCSMASPCPGLSG